MKNETVTSKTVAVGDGASTSRKTDKMKSKGHFMKRDFEPRFARKPIGALKFPMGAKRKKSLRILGAQRHFVGMKK